MDSQSLYGAVVFIYLYLYSKFLCYWYMLEVCVFFKHYNTGINKNRGKTELAVNNTSAFES